MAWKLFVISWIHYSFYTQIGLEAQVLGNEKKFTSHLKCWFDCDWIRKDEWMQTWYCTATHLKTFSKKVLNINWKYEIVKWFSRKNWKRGSLQEQALYNSTREYTQNRWHKLRLIKENRCLHCTIRRERKGFCFFTICVSFCSAAKELSDGITKDFFSSDGKLNYILKAQLETLSCLLIHAVSCLIKSVTWIQ